LASGIFSLKNPIGTHCDNDILYPSIPTISLKDPRFSMTYLITFDMKCVSRGDFCPF
jgi:hypothetical protein